MSLEAALLETSSDTADVLIPPTTLCPLCGEPARPWLKVPGDGRRPQHRATYRLAWCDDCDYGHLADRPSPDELADAYDVAEYYTHDAAKGVGSTGRLLDRLLVRGAWTFDRGVEAEIDAGSLARHGVQPGASVCDVGCGNGGLLRRLAAAGFAVVGIDPDADARQVVRESGLQVCAGSGESLPPGLADAQFDVVTMTHVLEHCLDPAWAVANVATLLDDGGLFFVETPNNACAGVRRARETWRWLDVPRHLNFFTPESLQAVCRTAGLEIVAVEFTGYTRQFRSEWIADEREIHRRFSAAAGATGRRLPAPNSATRAALQLAATCFAAPRRKYDSVRVVARKR